MTVAVRADYRRRLERLGATVTDWQLSDLIMRSDGATSTNRAPSATASGIIYDPLAPPSGTTFMLLSYDRPSSRTALQASMWIVMRMMREDKAKNDVEDQNRGLITDSSSPPSSSSPSRDWSTSPIYICTADMIFWLESLRAMKDIMVTMEQMLAIPPFSSGSLYDPSSSSPPSASSSTLSSSSRNRCRQLIDHHVLTWPDFCLWNSTTSSPTVTVPLKPMRLRDEKATAAKLTPRKRKEEKEEAREEAKEENVG